MQNWNKQNNDILHLRRRLGNRHYCANKCSPCVFSLPILGHASFWRLIIVDRLSAQKWCLFTCNWDSYNLFINLCCDQTKTKSMTLGFMCAILPSLSLLGKYSCFILICHFITRIFNIECFKYPIYKNVLKTLSAIFQFL